MKLQVFTFNPFQENTYVLSSGKQAVVIDPGCSDAGEEKRLLDYLEENDLHVEACWLTHAHIDHILGLRWFQTNFNVPIIAHPKEQMILEGARQSAMMFGLPFTAPDATKVSWELEDEKILNIGDEPFTCIFAPGHSPGSICFYHAESSTLIGGDVLFLQSIGRTDLPGGDFDTLEASIQKRIYTLPDETTVYPGHGPKTTVGFEKKNNSFVRA